MSENKPRNEVEMKGWLLKWTNYIKGYQKRWFVLTNGLLSYYRNQAEMAHTCRGTVSLHGALIHTVDACTFVISNGGAQTFHIKTTNEVERQRWVTALELAKSRAIRAMESEEEEERELRGVEDVQQEMEGLLSNLNSRLEDMQTCNDLINKHGSTLQRSLTDLEQYENPQDVTTKMKTISERATLFRISANAMINACSEFLDMGQNQGTQWQKLLQNEQEQRFRLERVIEQLASQQNILEEEAAGSQMHASTSATSDEEDEETEFFDALQTVQKTSSDTSSSNFFGPHDVVEFDGNFCPYKPERRRQVEEVSGSGSDVEDSSGPKPSADNALKVKEKRIKKAKKAPHSRKSLPSQKSKQPVPGTAKPFIVQDSPKSASPETYTTVYPGTSSTEAYAGTSTDSFPGTSKDDSPGTSTDTSEPGPLIKLPLGPGEKLTVVVETIGRPGKRRSRVPDRPNCSLNLWSVLKNCIGKELSKIPMPVNFSEPLSMLQRLTEDFEYSELLDLAALCDNSAQQMAYVAAFTVSSYSSTAYRTGKPFNPLLGETFECDRLFENGWKAISEQVSHHPPMVAQHCEGRDWVSWQEFTMSSKFRGKYLQVVPLGITHCKFHKSENHYTWKKVTTTVHNIIVGKLWIDQSGEMEIINHKDGTRCVLNYIPYSYFARDVQRRVTGCVFDNSGVARFQLRGTWNGKIEYAPITATEGTPAEPIYKTAGFTTAWRNRDPLPDSEKFYNFTLLACQLNEMELGIAPTDSRIRPDQRLMEQGRFHEANIVKQHLEERQRAARRERENNAEKATSDGEEYISYEPKWFKREMDPLTGSVAHVYKGGYWESKEKQDWTGCPILF